MGQAAMTTTPTRGRLVQFNVFRPKPGMMDAFFQRQIKGLAGLGQIDGLISSRLYRANDDSDAILVSEWESEGAQHRFTETPGFHAHRQSLQPLLESASPAFYTLTYERGATKVLLT